VKPLLNVRATDDEEERSPDQPDAASALNPHGRCLYDGSARPRSGPGDPMGVSTNLQLSRDDRPVGRERRDWSMPQTVHVDKTGAEQHGDDQANGQQQR